MEFKKTIVIERQVTRREVEAMPREELAKIKGRLWRRPDGIEGPDGTVAGYDLISEETAKHMEAANGAAKMLQEFLRNVGSPLQVDDMDGMLVRPRANWDDFEVSLFAPRR